MSRSRLDIGESSLQTRKNARNFTWNQVANRQKLSAAIEHGVQRQRPIGDEFVELNPNRYEAVVMMVARA
jgi:hypothetical protein